MIPGLPSTYVNSADEADTLEITMVDKVTGGELTLVYTAFENCNVILRALISKTAAKKLL